jgi:hypothetical protein
VYEGFQLQKQEYHLLYGLSIITNEPLGYFHLGSEAMGIGFEGVWGARGLNPLTLTLSRFARRGNKSGLGFLRPLIL